MHFGHFALCRKKNEKKKKEDYWLKKRKKKNWDASNVTLKCIISCEGSRIYQSLSRAHRREIRQQMNKRKRHKNNSNNRNNERGYTCHTELFILFFFFTLYFWNKNVDVQENKEWKKKNRKRQLNGRRRKKKGRKPIDEKAYIHTCMHAKTRFSENNALLHLSVKLVFE